MYDMDIKWQSCNKNAKLGLQIAKTRCLTAPRRSLLCPGFRRPVVNGRPLLHIGQGCILGKVWPIPWRSWLRMVFLWASSRFRWPRSSGSDCRRPNIDLATVDVRLYVVAGNTLSGCDDGRLETDAVNCLGPDERSRRRQIAHPSVDMTDVAVLAPNDMTKLEQNTKYM